VPGWEVQLVGRSKQINPFLVLGLH
jgi:hypothetical protein